MSWTTYNDYLSKYVLAILLIKDLDLKYIFIAYDGLRKGLSVYIPPSIGRGI